MTDAVATTDAEFLEALRERLSKIPDDDGRWMIEEINGYYTVTPFHRWLENRQQAWIPVNGTGCPVDPNKLVGVRWRNWQEYMGLAGGFQWHWAKKPQNEAWDIIAYMTL